MTVTQNRMTGKVANTALPLGVKNKQKIYISEKDGRNNPTYLNSHPGEIVVLSEENFALWLKQEYSISSSSGSSPALNDDETIDLYGAVNNAIGTPGIPKWDKADIHYVSTDSGILENIIVTFDTCPNDPDDGSYKYHVHYEIFTPDAPMTVTLTVDNLQTYPSITANWTSITSATNYKITAVGTNINSLNITTDTTYIFTQLLRSTEYTITVTAYDSSNNQISTGSQKIKTGAASTDKSPISTSPTTGTGNSGVNTPSEQAAIVANFPVGEITITDHSNSQIAISWPSLTSATSYTITYTGYNIPGKHGVVASHTCVVPSGGGKSDNNPSFASGVNTRGCYTFILKAQTSYPFLSFSLSNLDSIYKFSVQANYKSGSSIRVYKEVAIHV
jgi:hypothetical protein